MPRKRIHDWCQRWLITADEATTRARSVFGATSGMAPTLPLQLSDLEPRILFSATPIDLSTMPGGEEAAMVVEVAVDDSSSESSQTTINEVAETSHGEIVIVDSAVPNIEQLLDDLSTNGKEVFVLDADRDGLDQITEILEDRSDVQSLHIVSHADDGSINLGNLQLTSSNLTGYAGQLASWQSVFASDADILFYGCDLAGNADGQELLDSIAVLTGADVAASTDDTGHSSLGGDWDFEFTTGSIEADVVFSSSIESDWYGLLTLGAYESFNYSTGSLDGADGGSGWATAWSRISGTSSIVNGTSLSDPTGTLGTSGGSVQMNTTSLYRESRHLSNAIGIDGTTMWASFLVQVDTLSSGISLELGDQGGSDDTITIGTSGNDFLLGKNASALGGSKVDNVLVDGQTYLLVAKLEFASGNDTVTLYVDPTPGVSDPDTIAGMTTQLTTADLGTFTEVGLIGGFSGNNSSIDEIRIGNTFADVAPVQTTLAATKDTYLSKDQASDNFGSSATLVLNSGSGDIGKSLPVIQFDVSSIPVGATISNAMLQLEAISGSGSTINIGVYELLQSWTEGDGTTGPANWTESSVGVNWVANSDPHSSYDATALDTLSTADTGQHSWDITALVEAWIDGSKTNNGVIVGSEDGGTETFTYSSREGVTAPTLVINYSLPVVPPNADAGGPYTINEGDSVSLDGSASDDPDGTIVSYRWDLDNDGTFEEPGEPTSDTATVSWATLAGFGINNEGTYNVRLQVTDNDGETDESIVAITVNNVAPDISSSLTPSVAENTTVVQTVTTSEPTDPVTFTVTGGADQDLFTINGSGVLSFVTAPDFENPGDSDWDNVYEVEVTTDDGTATDVQTISVTVSNQNDVAVVAVGDTYEVNEDASLDSNSTWFDSNWGFRRAINFNNSGQSETFSDLPILVELNSSVIDFAKTQDAGEDLRFTDSSGNLLAHDIELWNESGTSYVWVLVPSITQSSATDSIHMYYGNATALDGQNKSGVWSSGYDAVYHLHDDVADSTVNANAGTNAGSSDATGLFGDAQNFDDIGDVITLGSTATLDDVFSGGGAVSVWINPASFGESGLGRILDKASGTVPSPGGWSLAMNASSDSLIFEMGFANDFARWRVEDNAMEAGVWQQVTVVYDSTDTVNPPQIYVNGVLKSVTESKSPDGAVLSDAGIDLAIGNHQAATNRSFDGLIDEVRISSSTQSAERVMAQFLAETNSFTTVGFEQTTAGVLGNDVDQDGQNLTATLDNGPLNASAFHLNSDGSFTYTPNANFNGDDTFTYFANDGTGDSSIVTVTISVAAVNDAPSINAASLSAIDEDNLSPAGERVSSLFSITDVDDSASLSGIVVVANTANSTTEGGWQYSSDDGVTWANVDTVSAANGLAISASSLMRFTPVADYNGTPAALDVRALDDSYAGSFSTTPTSESRQTVDTSSPTATTAFSNTPVTLGTSVTAVNDAPDLGGLSNQIGSDNTTMTPFSAATIADVEGDNVSIVITLSDGDANGVFTTASLGSFTKTDVGEYTLSSTTTTGAQAAIRSLVFDPTDNQVVVGSSVGTTISIAMNDGSDTPSSSLSITVNSINDAPTIANATLGAIAENDSDPPGAAISGLFGASFSDPDINGALSGVVVVGNGANAVTQGRWQYSSDNGTNWSDVGTASASSGLVIESTSFLRFLPVAAFSGTPTSLTLLGLDNTYSASFSTTDGGAETRQMIDTSAGSATSAFSASSVTLGTSVTANAAPTVGGTNSQTIDDTETVDPFTSVTIGDAEGDAVTVSIQLSGGDSNGAFTASSLTASGFIHSGVGTYSLSSTSVADAQEQIRKLVFDPTENQVSAGSSVTTTFSITIDDGAPVTNSSTTITAVSVNDAPSLSNAALTASDEDTTPTGDSVSSVFAAVFNDSDTTASLTGIVVVSDSTDPVTEGVWQYSSDGTAWFDIGTVDEVNGLTISANSLIRYVPTTNFNGTPTALGVRGLDETFTGSFSTTTTGETRQTIDTSSPQATSAFSIAITELGASVTAVNDKPTLSDVEVEIFAGNALRIRPAAFETISDDVEGDTLTPQIVSNASNGTAFVNAGGVVVYRPDAGFVGTDTFQLAAFDGTDLSDPATVTITVKPAFVPPSEGGEPKAEEETPDEETDETEDTEEDGDIVSGAGLPTDGEDDDEKEADGPVAVAPVLTTQSTASNQSGNKQLELSLASSIQADDGHDRYGAIRQTVEDFSQANERLRHKIVNELLESASQMDFALFASQGVMWNELNERLTQVESRLDGDLISVQAAGAAASSFTVAVMAWTIRSGLWASSFLAQMPAWRAVDPLMIMQGAGDEDDETLEELMNRESQSLDDE